MCGRDRKTDTGHASGRRMARPGGRGTLRRRSTHQGDLRAGARSAASARANDAQGIDDQQPDLDAVRRHGRRLEPGDRIDERTIMDGGVQGGGPGPRGTSKPGRTAPEHPGRARDCSRNGQFLLGSPGETSPRPVPAPRGSKSASLPGYPWAAPWPTPHTPSSGTPPPARWPPWPPCSWRPWDSPGTPSHRRVPPPRWRSAPLPRS